MTIREVRDKLAIRRVRLELHQNELDELGLTAYSEQFARAHSNCDRFEEIPDNVSCLESRRRNWKSRRRKREHSNPSLRHSESHSGDSLHSDIDSGTCASENENYSPVLCYFCGKWGHKAKFCKERKLQKKFHDTRHYVQDFKRLKIESPNEKESSHNRQAIPTKSTKELYKPALTAFEEGNHVTIRETKKRYIPVGSFSESESPQKRGKPFIQEGNTSKQEGISKSKLSSKCDADDTLSRSLTNHEIVTLAFEQPQDQSVTDSKRFKELQAKYEILLSKFDQLTKSGNSSNQDPPGYTYDDNLKSKISINREKSQDSSETSSVDEPNRSLKHKKFNWNIPRFLLQLGDT